MVTNLSSNLIAVRRYRKTIKGKATNRRYRESEKGKAVNRAVQKRWRQSLKGKEAQKRIRERDKINVFLHYSNGQIKCACECGCSISFIGWLTIDHTGGWGAQHRREIPYKGGSSFYRWLIRNKFPKRFRVRCFNCNCGICPT